MTCEEARLLAAAYHAGAEAAAAIGKGDRFTGAMPAARASGYADDKPAFRLFVTGYLDVLHARYPRGVLVDDSGIVIDEPAPSAIEKEA